MAIFKKRENIRQEANVTEALNFYIHFNPYLTNGFSHHYQLGESNSIFKGVRSSFIFFYLIFLCANRIAPDGTPRSAPRK